MTPENESLIRIRLDDMIRPRMGSGKTLLSPLFYNDASEYWRSNSEVDYTTQDQLETSTIKAAWVLFSGFTDDPTTPAHSPLITLNYQLYLFEQYDSMREDESSIDPEFVDQRQLKVYNDFIATILRLKAAFQGERVIPGLPDFTVKETLPLTIIESIQERVECIYIPGVIGFSIRLGIPVRIELREC